MSGTKIWLRAETKPQEARSARKFFAIRFFWNPAICIDGQMLTTGMMDSYTYYDQGAARCWI
jgi:hypothetical protein